MIVSRGFCRTVLLVMCSVAPLIIGSAQKAPTRKATAPTYVLVPEIYPGDPIGKVAQIFGAEAGMRQQRKDLRDYQWWETRMSVEIWTDGGDQILSVKFRFKNVPIKTPDGIFIGKDSLNGAQRKLGDRFLGEGSSIYHLDLDCWAFYIGAKGSESSNWDINYESIECRKGDISEAELRAAPINNMSRQKNGFTEPD